MSKNTKSQPKSKKETKALVFPAEFDYKKEYRKYKYMGNPKYEDKEWYCKNFVSWRKNFKATYHTINTEDDRLQLEWALRDHLKFQPLWRNAIIGIIFVAFVSIAPYLIKFVLQAAESDSSNFSPEIELFVSGVIVLIILLPTIIYYGKSIGEYRFDQEALRTIALIKTGKDNINEDEDNDE